MAKPQERAFALIMALLFLGTTVAVTAAVIFEIRKQRENEKIMSEVQKQLAQQTDSQTLGENSSNNQQANEQPKEGALQGTKLVGYTPVDKVDSLQIIDITPGTGDEVKAGATVTAHYTGALVKDGTIFQSSKDTGQPFTSPLSGLIAGWQQGIPGMKVGGTRRLIIPAAQAYGDRAQPGIPANSDLVFDIELISVQQ